MGQLAEYLQKDGVSIRDTSAARKAEKLHWQRAVRELVDQMERWITDAEPKDVLRYHRGTLRIEGDYDVGQFELATFTIVLGRETVRITPTHVPVVGRLQVPGDEKQRQAIGRVDFDNGIDRRNLYCVQKDDRDIWLWWGHGGVGFPFDRESFESAVVSLLQ
jgi:hypothetical protein